MEVEKFNFAELLTVLVIVALFDFLVFSLMPDFFGYSLILSFATTVYFGVGLAKHGLRPRHSVWMVFGPVLVILVLLAFSSRNEAVLGYMSMFFERYFSHVFIGISGAAKDLAGDGFQSRVIPVQGYTMLSFAITSCFAWMYLVRAATVEGNGQAAVSPFVQQSWFTRNATFLMLIAIFGLASMFLDFYSPNCKSRCNGVRKYNFVFVVGITMIFSMLYWSVGLLIHTNLIYKAGLAKLMDGGSE